MDPTRDSRSICSNMNSNDLLAHDIITNDLLCVPQAITITSSNYNNMNISLNATSVLSFLNTLQIAAPKELIKFTGNPS